MFFEAQLGWLVQVALREFDAVGIFPFNILHTGTFSWRH